MMKILIAMDGYFPGKKFGGPPVSTNNFCSLMNEDNCYIVTKNHDLGERNPYENITSGEWIERDNCKVIYFNDSEYNIRNFKKVVLEIKPDVVYLQSLFDDCIICFLMLARKYNIRVLLAPRGQLCAGAFKKKYKKIPYILILRLLGCTKTLYCQSTSAEESEAIFKYLKIPRSRIMFLTNVPSIPSQKKFDYSEKRSGSAKFVFLSRIHPKKNLMKAISFLKNINGEAKLDIYGPIEDEIYWEQCQQEIKKLPNNVVVNYCGLVSHDMVHETFARYDAFLFPTFSENYGHVIIEALVAGCPAIISDQTPWNDLEEHNSGWVYSLDEQEKFEQAVQTIIDVDSNCYKLKAIEYAKNKLDLEELKEEYIKAFQKVLLNN